MLVPLFEDAAGTVQVVLTQRAHTLSSHGGALESLGCGRSYSTIGLPDHPHILPC